MKRLFLISFMLGSIVASAQKYSIDITPADREILSGHLKMGHPGPAGSEIIVNSRYMTIGGNPVIPVMGEIHFSRVAREQWRDYLLKMKANGINIIATYLFWIHHEEAEGNFDWSGNKDFRAFVKLCAELGLHVYPRVGPWCHGEARNGGTPDWILLKKNIANRTNDPVYQSYVERYFGQIARQLEGLLYKDGGPVTGIQLENEYWRGQGGEAHIRWLKETIRAKGVDVPMYTVTGWGNVSVPQDEVIPLYGDYPEEPWATNVDRPSNDKAFTFDWGRDSEAIGNEQLIRDGKYAVDIARYPYFTCELGVGNQISYHRRPILDSRDGYAIATAKVGSGSNLPGYYVFAGGTNPPGMLTPMQEDQHETGMHNEYPATSYDFQAAIGETGELAPSYYQVKKLHYFLSEFGQTLAPYLPSFPAAAPDKLKDLQWSVRSDGTSGYIFGLNYIRGTRRPEQKEVQFSLKLRDGSRLRVPSTPVDIADSVIFIWPFNFSLNGVNMLYSTAQPLASPERDRWVFFREQNLATEFAFGEGAQNVASTSGKVEHKGGVWTVSGMNAGMGEKITVTAADGSTRTIHLLSDKEAQQSWLVTIGDKKRFFVSDADITADGGTLMLTSKKAEMTLYALSGEIPSGNSFTPVSAPEGWKGGKVAVTPVKPKVEVKEKSLLDDAAQLQVNVDGNVSGQQALSHKYFFKEFGLYNPAQIRSATLYIYGDLESTIRINNLYVNQSTAAGKLSRVDITGYVRKGENSMQIGFPVVNSPARMAAVVEVYFHNGERVAFDSGRDWLTSVLYAAPAPWAAGRYAAPTVLDPVALPGYDGYKIYEVEVPYDAFDGLNNLYLSVDYSGDTGRAYLDQNFVWDNFNNGTPWRMNLSTLGTRAEGATLDMLINPMPAGAKIRLDKPVSAQAAITKCEIVPEYKASIMISD